MEDAELERILTRANYLISEAKQIDEPIAKASIEGDARDMLSLLDCIRQLEYKLIAKMSS